jgi:hypothetical protein
MDVKRERGQPENKDRQRDRGEALQDQIITSDDSGGKPEPESDTNNEGGARHERNIVSVELSGAR